MADVQTAVIDPALRKIGVKSPSAAEQADVLAALNALINSNASREFMQHFVTRENFTLTIGKAEYTWGSGGDFTTARPTSILDGFIRDGSTDSPLRIETLQEYNDIVSKTDEGLPESIVYLPEHPLGKIVLDSEPDKAYTLFLDSIKRIGTFAAIGTTFDLPEEYERYFVFNLAIDIASEFNETISPEIFRIANETKNSLISLNSSVRMVEPVKAERAVTWNLQQ